MKFVSLHNHSDYSLLDGLSQVHQITGRAKELGQLSIALTDHGSVSGIPSFAKSCKDIGIRGIYGCELYVPLQDSSIKTPENRSTPHLPVLAKNLAGWQSLMKLVSESNKKENYYYKPRLDIQQISKYTGNLICFSGHIGTQLADSIFQNPKAAYRANFYEEAKSFIATDWEEKCIALIENYKSIFGTENFYIEIQAIDQENIPAVKIIVKALRHLAKKCSCKKIATGDSHMPRRQDAADQRLLLCSALKTTFNRVNTSVANNEDVMLGGFFKSNNYFIPGYDDLVNLHEPDELLNTLEIAEKCENYDILCRPRLAEFPCQNANEEMRQRCRDGWRRLIVGTIPKSEQEKYLQRVTTELKVFEEAGLAHYFLVVADICRYAQHDLGVLMGAARGSAGGCLVSMLLGITNKAVDPVKNGLTFERFYNAGRNTKDRVSLPDIDLDLPAGAREQVFSYIRNKYGHDKVAQIATFGTLQGRGALKEVLRVHEVCSFAEMGRITQDIPDESRISDDLQEMEEEFGSSSILKWSLEHQPESLKEYCILNKEGQLKGPYARYFAQAIRLEGVKKSQGKHAAGIIISPIPLNEICPLIYDKKSDHSIVGLGKDDCELLGLVKIDVLGISLLDKLMDIEKLLLNGQLEEEQPFIEGSDSGPADGSV